MVSSAIINVHQWKWNPVWKAGDCRLNIFWQRLPLQLLFFPQSPVKFILYFALFKGWAFCAVITLEWNEITINFFSTKVSRLPKIPLHLCTAKRVMLCVDCPCSVRETQYVMIWRYFMGLRKNLFYICIGTTNTQQRTQLCDFIPCWRYCVLLWVSISAYKLSLVCGWIGC